MANISREDVINVAQQINVELDDNQIEIVLGNYPSEEQNDPTATWNLIVENTIYAHVLNE